MDSNVTTPTAEICRSYIEAMKKKIKLKAELTKQNKEIQHIDAVLTERMDEEGTSELTTDEGIKLTKIIDETFSLEGEAAGEEWNQENGHFFQWLREIGEHGLIKDNVNHKTRDNFLKEFREERKNLPEFIKIAPWKHIKTNQSAIKRLVEDEG